MNTTIKTLAIAALFIFPGLSAFPQDKVSAAKPVVENVAFPILIGIP